MTTDLRKQLGKSQVESIKDTPTNADNQTKSSEAPHEHSSRRFLVVVGGDNNPVEDAETLQELANIPTLPQTRVAWFRQLHVDDASKDNKVDVADISCSEMRLLKDRTEFEEVSVRVKEQGTESCSIAILVKAVKERWTTHHTGPWSPELWVAANEALRRGEVVPEPRFPIIINDNDDGGPIDSPEALQQLLGLPDVPLVTATNRTDPHGKVDGELVRITDIGWDHTDLFKERAVTEKVYVWFYDVRAKKTIPRLAYVVKSIKEG